MLEWRRNCQCNHTSSDKGLQKLTTCCNIPHWNETASLRTQRNHGRVRISPGKGKKSRSEFNNLTYVIISFSVTVRSGLVITRVLRLQLFLWHLLGFIPMYVYMYIHIYTNICNMYRYVPVNKPLRVATPFLWPHLQNADFSFIFHCMMWYINKRSLIIPPCGTFTHLNSVCVRHISSVLVLAAAGNKSATRPPLPPPGCGGERKERGRKPVGRDKGSLTEQQTEGTGTTMVQIRRKHNNEPHNPQSRSPE